MIKTVSGKIVWCKFCRRIKTDHGFFSFHLFEKEDKNYIRRKLDSGEFVPVFCKSCVGYIDSIFGEKKC